jgi:hypothetical protein
MTVALCAAWLGIAEPGIAADADEAIGFERTPPRLSFTDGEVSFLRLGAEDWAPALVNTPLAAGDELYAAEAANLELQVAARAYVRAGENTQLGVSSIEPDFLQLRVTSGTVSLDLRSLKAGQTFELDTPNAAFTVERTGYYRVEVDGEITTFTSRRGGRATLAPALGEPFVVAASEQVVVTGDETPQIESYAADELDAWDRWNYARTDEQLDAVSARYVPAGVYGAGDLDYYGYWRIVPTYGPIWVPRGVGVGWAPYSTGRWIWDPYYHWTWVDDAPWGWAPYHYGRWVYVSGYWGWCPGPIVARPYYAPALVGFYGGGGFSIGVQIGTPYLGWVALGWGEPLIPWWGPARFRAYPRWAGWGGPRYVNTVLVKNKTVIRVKDVKFYRNARERDAFVTVDRRQFGRRDRGNTHYGRGKPDDFQPVYGDLSVRPDRSSLVAERGSVHHPARDTWMRPVVATREPRRDPTPEFEPRRGGAKAAPRASSGERRAAPEAAPPARVALPPHKGKRITASGRPPFGKRGESERATPPPAPRFERRASSESGSNAPRASQERPRATAPAPAPAAVHRAKPGERPQVAPRKGAASPPSAAPREHAAPPAGDLPGEPANRIFRSPHRQNAGPQSRASGSGSAARAGKGRSSREGADSAIDGSVWGGRKQPGPARGR